MDNFIATQKKILRLIRLQHMQDNATFNRTWLLFQKAIHIEKMKIGRI